MFLFFESFFSVGLPVNTGEEPLIGGKENQCDPDQFNAPPRNTAPPQNFGDARINESWTDWFLRVGEKLKLWITRLRRNCQNWTVIGRNIRAKSWKHSWTCFQDFVNLFSRLLAPVFENLFSRPREPVLGLKTPLSRTRFLHFVNLFSKLREPVFET